MDINKMNVGLMDFDDLRNINLDNYSKQELIDLQREMEDQEAYWNTTQMALKISMNSLN